MPVHQLPTTLALVNSALERRIFPALSWQYGVEARRLRVFDAFVVKYDAAGGQRSLPVHTDQSVMSDLGVWCVGESVCVRECVL